MARKSKGQKAEALPLVAIELGSHSVRAMAAERIDSDLIRILGVEESKKYPCVQNGMIAQTANAGYMISEVLRLLANRIGLNELPTAFVTVGGRSVQAVSVFSKRDQVRRREIAASLLEDMERECKRKIEERNPEAAVIGLVPAFYVLDGVEQDHAPTPIQRAVLVETHYIAFVGRKELETQLQKSFDQAGKSIERTFVRQEALLSAFACEDGEEILTKGCAVLDLGAQTTTLSIYKGTEYLYHKVVAQGGYHITRVIEQQGIGFQTAETLKTQYGFAGASQVDKNLRMRIAASQEVGGELTITSEELAYMIEMKLEEIVGPLMTALQSFQDRIGSLYITGGGAMLRGIDQYLQQKTRIPVVYGAHDRLIVVNENANDNDNDNKYKYYEPQYTALVGCLIMGADHREQHKGELVKKPNILDKIEGTMIEIFSDIE